MDKYEKELVGLYKELEDEIKAAIDSGKNNTSSTFHKQLNEKVNKIFSEHNTKVNEWVQSSVTNLYEESKSKEEKKLKADLKLSDDDYTDLIKLSSKEKDKIESSAIEEVVSEKAAKMKFANSTLLRNITSAINDNAKEKGKRQKDIAKSLKEDIYSEDGDGKISIKCKDGKVRKYDPQKYAETIAKQAKGEAQSAAALSQAKELGTEIMEMSSHSPTCKICAKLQGRWYSLNKENTEFPYIYDTAWRNGKTIHPGCKHTFRPVSMDMVDEATKEKMKKYSNRSFEESSQDEKMLQQYYEDQKKKAELAQDKDDYDELLKTIDTDDLPSFDDYVKIKEDGGEEWDRIKELERAAEETEAVVEEQKKSDNISKLDVGGQEQKDAVAEGSEDYSKLAEETIPKFSNEAIDLEKDYEFANKVKETRGILTSRKKGSGNFGFAETNVTGLSRKEFFAHSSIQSDNFIGELPNRVPDISLEPAKPVFNAIKVNKYNVVDNEKGYLRDVDSEYKIINDIANRLGDNTDAAGTIKLFTDRVPCPSCSRVINKFMEKYPDIVVEVSHNNGTILK